jgi:hypothetical protein
MLAGCADVSPQTPGPEEAQLPQRPSAYASELRRAVADPAPRLFASVTARRAPAKVYVKLAAGAAGEVALPGRAGDEIDIWVRSPNGDPEAWLLDGSSILAANDNAGDETNDAHLRAKLSSDGEYRIRFRDVDDQAAEIAVEIQLR